MRLGSTALATERVDRRLAAILAADVAGYSRLIGADEQGTLTRLKAIRSEVIDPWIAAHRGRIVKTTGDGLLVAAPSMRCVVPVQFRRRWPSATRRRFRKTASSGASASIRATLSSKTGTSL